ncbi:MAG: response regulator [Chitinophagales bacterium]
MKISLDRKILLGFALCAVILLVVVGTLFRNNEKFIGTNQWVSHTREVLYELNQIQSNAIELQGSVHSYILTGNDNFLQLFNTAKTQSIEHLEKAKALTKDNPTQQSNLQNVETLLQARIDYSEKLVDVLRDKGQAAAQKMISEGEGTRMLKEIRTVTQRAEETENTLLAERQKASDDDAGNFLLTSLFMVLIIFAVLVAVYFIINTNLKALRKAEDENAAKNWSLTGTVELNNVLRGEKDVHALAEEVVTQLSRYLNAQVGAFYILENGMLELAGSYAYNFRKDNITSFKVGEGLAGQVAREKKAIVFSDVPADYMRVQSGLGFSAPKSILVFPVLYNNELRGVIELGSINTFAEREVELITILAENIGITVNAAQANVKLKELLEETQRQAEELEAQQEELKQSNEELQEKTELLEKSEAELKAQQEELQQANEELEEKANLLEEQKEVLENAKLDIETKARELEITSRYKSEFLANMSHELRTPLNSILILAQLLSENKNSLLGQKEVEYSSNIYNSGMELLNLINEILDLSKVESGRMELDISEVTITEVNQKLKAMFSEVAINKSIEFKIDYDAAATGAVLQTDSQRMEQILRNLLSNAFKFTGKGGEVKLSISKASANTTFKSSNLQHNQVLRFAVSDTGIGIAPDKQGIIFEAFQQADGSTKRKYGGTGLGLSISRELAHVLGGEIHLTSVEGQGSTFSLYLPVTYTGSSYTVNEKIQPETKDNVTSSSPRTQQGPADDRPGTTEKDRSILIMEDDEQFAALLLDFVRERNYKGIVATQGNTGLNYARIYKPDAILLDLQLPVMDGAEVLKQLKSDPALRHIPVQIISGFDRRKESLQLGAFDFVHKPVSKEQLKNVFEKIESFVSRKLKRLLVVEDNPAQNQAICDLIGNGDVRTLSAFSGKEALELLGTQEVDCIIVDLGLPDMSGFEVLEKIKNDAGLNKIPIVVYTAKDLSKEEVTRLNKLANTVVLKTANSQERLLDETALFLHRVEARLPADKQQILRKLHRTDEVLKGKKVLLVDDDIRNIYSLSHLLEGEGMSCVIAENGKVALKMLKDNPDTEIILMDVMMPEMDGYEATQAIRQLPAFAKLPIIALTAKAMKGDREKCLNAGMSDYVSKPVHVEQLLSLMRVWLYK